MKLLWWLPFGRVPEISADALSSRLDDVQVVDVRTEAEFRRSHISGARSVPVHRLGGAIPGLGLDHDRPVVAICRTAHRSIPAVRLLRAYGYDACQLAGGMVTWWKKDLPAQRG